MLNYKKYSLILESAPRIPVDAEYWKRKGKSGKEVCIIFHDDMDGIVSAIIMKNWLLNKGFIIKKYAIINYQESWEALKLDKKYINIALDYAEDSPDVDVYMDHHGSFEEEVRLRQQKKSIKTQTGSAAEGIAQQLGVPFGKEVKDWIDMIDSAKYDYYKVKITDILNFDLKAISKDKNSKLRFASAFNQLLKRSDYTTFIEVVNASKDPSIFNLFRLFKIFFPKNNPNWRSGEEAEFVEDAKQRLQTMQQKTRGKYNADEKTRYTSYKEFWAEFASKVEGKRKDDGGEVWKLQPGSYQLIGNLMFVPSGTWANALRAKAIFVEDKNNGIIDEDSKMNFTLLQYGNTLQCADLDCKIKDMKEEDLPVTTRGEKISHLGKYMEGLVKNFGQFLGYHDERTFSGGHDGIGTISNIFGKCQEKPFVGTKFLDLFKNKVIADLSGAEWSLAMPWNDEEGKPTVPEDEINMRMLGDDEIRSEKEAIQEKKERRYLSWVIMKDDWDVINVENFKTPSIKKLYEFLRNMTRNPNFGFLGEWLNSADIQKIWFKDRERDSSKLEKDGNFFVSETSGNMYDELIKHYGFDVDKDGNSYPYGDTLYQPEATNYRKKTRKEVKRLMTLIGHIMRGSYLSKDREKYEQDYKKWRKK